VSSPPACHFVVLAVIALRAPSAFADVTSPKAKAAPAPTTMRTRWPAVLPCPRPRDLTVSSPSSKDVLRWSSPGGAELTLVANDSGARPIPPALLRDPPRSLTWRRHGRPDQVSGGEMSRPVSPHDVGLWMKCADSYVEGDLQWSCDDRQASCRLSVSYPYRDPDERRRHRGSLADLARVVQAGAGARDLVIADALRLAQEACAGDRCAEVVSRAVQQLRAVGKQPPWTVAPPHEQWFELIDPAAPDHKLRCDAVINRYCSLTLGSSLGFILHGEDSTFGGNEEVGGAGWELRAYPSGFWLYDDAVR
jgi:hypothetical protein